MGVMRQAARSQDNPNFIKMYHGRLEINVPRSMFVGNTVELVPEEVERFRRTLSSRYPWLSRYALDEIVKGAQEAMADHMERTKGAVQRAREHLAKGQTRIALRLVEDHLVKEPEDADAWFLAAELLLKMGKGEDGFRAMNRARELSRR
ncbi:hypothetical protein AOA80_09075 [Methanomassiliicoccales archaeon RumEn M1]|jgi:hypothetical protein|nr:hypothetical protein AOA80_09075 [Methanomassiliicoccales archaeon RumEn M1]